MNQIINYINNKINQKQKIKITMNKNMNKKIFSITIFGIAAFSLLFFAGISSAQASVTFQGDLPDDGINYRVEAYTAAQGSPCDAAADAGLKFFSTGWGPGDSNYDDNDDYESGAFTATSTPAHIYLCRSGDAAGTSRVYFTHAIADANAYELDFGFITGTANVHDDLGSKYVHVCDALTGGTELSSVNAATAVDGSYSQYYYMWQGTVTANGGNINNVYMFIDDDTTSKCTFDATKKAGLYIDPNSVTPYNYGIYITDYSPGNKISAASNLHNDIDGWIRVKSNATGNPNIGLTGLVAAETYTLYYDEPASDKVITAEAFKAAVDTAADVAMTVSNIDYNFSALSLFRKISGTTPSDVSYVQTTLSPANTGANVVFRTTTDSSTPKAYTLYIPDGETPTIKFQDSGSVELFSYLYTGAVSADDGLWINKLSGDVHADLDASDVIRIFEGNTCTGTSTIQSIAVAPSGAGGTYAAYFADAGDNVDETENLYIKITQDTNYITCGNEFNTTNREADVDLTIQVKGSVSAGIDRAAVDDDAVNSDATTAASATCTAYADVSSNVYYLYSSTSTAVNAYLDSTSNVFFVATGALDTELVEINDTGVSADLTGSRQVDVDRFAGLTANVSADLKTGGAVGTSTLAIYDAADGITAVSSETVNMEANYNQYFIIPSALAINVEVQRASDTAKLFYINDFTVATATSYTFEPKYKVASTVDADILGIQIQQTNDGGYQMRDKTLATTYDIYADKTEEEANTDYTYEAYNANTFAASAQVLVRTGKDVSGVAAWGVNELTGAAHADLLVNQDAIDVLAIYNAVASGTPDCTGSRIDSEITGNLSATYKKYYEHATNDHYIVIKLQASDATNTFTSCQQTEVQMALAGDSDIYALDHKLSGNVAEDIADIRVDWTGDSVDWEIDIDVTDVASAADQYLTYFKGDSDADTDIEARVSTTRRVYEANSATDFSGVGPFTWHIGKISGDSHSDLNGNAVTISSDARCQTNVSTTAKNADATSYAQYFLGADGSYYVGIANDDGDVVCRSKISTVSAQESSTINFDGKLTGVTPDGATTTRDLLRVEMDLDAGGADYIVDLFDTGATSTYTIYPDSTLIGGGNDSSTFYDANLAVGGGNTLYTESSQTYVDGSAAVNLSVARGANHADLNDGTNTVNVCADDTMPAIGAGFGTCATTVSSAAITPSGAAYEIYFEQLAADTTYYLQVIDNDTSDYYSYNAFTSGSNGALNTLNVDGKLYGVLGEDYDSGTTKIEDVRIDIYENTGTTVQSTTKSYSAGLYRLYVDKAATRDFKFSKGGYVTKDWSTDVGTMNDQTFAPTINLNVNLVSGIKITIQDNGGDTITNAKVEIYTCSSVDPSTCTTLGTCTNPSTNCSRTGNNTTGNGASGVYYFAGITGGTYIQVRVTKSPFDTVFSPNSSDSVNSFQSGGGATGQLTTTVILHDSAPGQVVLGDDIPNGKVLTSSTPTLTWIDLGGGETDYDVQIDNTSDAFGALETGDGTTGDGNATFVIGTDGGGVALSTDNHQYWWRVRAFDGLNWGPWSEARSFYVNTGWNSMSAPTLTNTAGTSQVTISWSALTGATNYRVYRDSNASVANTDPLVGNSTGLSSVDYAPEGTWYYAVEPVDGTNTVGTISATSVSVTIDTIPLDIVFLNTPVPNSYFTAVTGTLSWIDVAGETSYTVEVADNSAMTTNLVTKTGIAAGSVSATVGAGQTVAKTLTDGASYYWRVKAVDSAGVDSPWSEIRKFTVDASPPTSLTVNNPGTTADSQSFLAKVTSGETGLTCKASLETNNWASMAIMADNGDNSYQAMVVSNGEGAKQVKFECRDAAGNAVTATQNVQVTYTYPAIVKITAPANAGYVNNASPAIDITAATSTLTCKLNLTSNNDNWNDASWATLDDDTDGTYSMAATASLGSNGLKTIYFKCQKAGGPVPVDAVSTTFTLDTASATYEFGAMSNPINVMSGDEVEAYYTANEDLATSPTATIGAKVATVTRSGRLIKISRVLDGTETDNNIVITGGTDLAGNTNSTLTDTNRITTDFVAPTLSTPAPADAATAQTSPIALSIVAGGAETGLDCRYHFAAATSTADIAFVSMGYLMSDNGGGTYGSSIYIPDGTWFVNIKCWDAAGNEAEFGDAGGAGYSFTVGTSPAAIAVTGISRTKSYATADGTYANGWAWVFDVTVPTAETSLKMKFANWVSGSNSIAVANNMRFYSSQAQTAVSQGTAITISTAGTYSSAMTLTGDRDTTKAGRQIQITVEAKVPADSSGGSYSTSYGIQSL